MIFNIPHLKSKVLLKVLIPIFLILSCYSFLKKPSLEIVLINSDIEDSSLLEWQQRRKIAQLIQKLYLSKAKAIVITAPCLGYTSVGADQALLKAVKQAGNVYFSIPLWDTLYPYAKAIGHIYVEKVVDLINIPETIFYDKKTYPALSILIARDFFSKEKIGSINFESRGSIFFKEYSWNDLINAKDTTEFKDKICFIGRKEINNLQALALYNLVSVKDNGVALFYAISLFLILCIILTIYLIKIKRNSGIIYFKNHKRIVKLPKKTGKLSFGLSYCLTQGSFGSIFDIRNFSAGHYWLWLGDFNSTKQKENSHLNNIRQVFFELNEGFGLREAMLRLNNHLYEQKNSVFTNLIHLDIKSEEGILHFSNAGFESPLLFINSHKEFREFPNVSMPLGIRQDILIDEQEIILEKSDIFFLFNSGIVKSRNREGEFIDLKQLKYMITQNSQTTAEELAKNILKVILDFNFKQPDLDMIFFVIKAN